MVVKEAKDGVRARHSLALEFVKEDHEFAEGTCVLSCTEKGGLWDAEAVEE